MIAAAKKTSGCFARKVREFANIKLMVVFVECARFIAITILITVIIAETARQKRLAEKYYGIFR